MKCEKCGDTYPENAICCCVGAEIMGRAIVKTCACGKCNIDDGRVEEAFGQMLRETYCLSQEYFSLMKRRSFLKQNRGKPWEESEGCPNGGNCWHARVKLEKEQYCDLCKARTKIHKELLKNASRRNGITKRMYKLLSL